MAIEIVAQKSFSGSPTVRLSGVQATSEPDGSRVYTFEGPFSAIETLLGTIDNSGSPSNALLYAGLPSGSSVTGASCHSNGDGTGTLTVTAKEWTTNSGLLFMSSTFRISMVETQFELKDHPTITKNDAALREVLLWLATDEKLRIKREGSYHYVDDEGEEQEVSEEEAIAFCNSYMHGITTFVRYYPVIEKISRYKIPPGLNTNTNTVGNYSGGSFSEFSDDIGKYSTPDITLNGYSSGGWFKSGDDWVENADHTWNRTERWTYTPDGSGGVHGWIYGSTEEDDE